jgi:hypothetical protein
MLTYSINTNTPIYTTSYPLTNNLIGLDSNFDLLINNLLDNDDKLIIPSTLRDFILSINDSTVFKLTHNTSGGNYIGFDSGNLATNRDLKNYKIVIGNRLKNNSDPIINQNVIDSDTDIILSKTTNLENNKISFITNVSDNLPSISVNIDTILSNKDNINITSEHDNININNVIFPTSQESQVYNIDDRYLVSENGKLIWKKLELNLLESDLNQNINLEGNVNLNLFSLDFKDNRKCPIQIGDVIQGESFLNVSLSDMLRKIIYNYLSPNVILSFLEPHSNNTIEVGSIIIPRVSYTIYKKTNPVNATFINLLPSSLPIISDIGYKVITGEVDCIIPSNLEPINYMFSSVLNDGVQNIQEDIILTGVYPYFYGFSTFNVTDNEFLPSLVKDIKIKSNTTLGVVGNGTYYFIYPHSYGVLSSINGLIPTPLIYSQFMNSNSGFWNNIRYMIYQFNNVNINTAENIQFLI